MKPAEELHVDLQLLVTDDTVVTVWFPVEVEPLPMLSEEMRVSLHKALGLVFMGLRHWAITLARCRCRCSYCGWWGSRRSTFNLSHWRVCCWGRSH